MNNRIGLAGSVILAGIAVVISMMILGRIQGITPAYAAGNILYVDGSVAGGDVPGCGTVVSPCQTVSYVLHNEATAGDTIRLAKDVYTENLTITKAITIEGGYQNEAGSWTRSITLYESALVGSDNDVVIRIEGENFSVVLDGLTVTGGLSAEAGGIYVDSNSIELTIRNCIIKNNQAAGSDDAWAGGGILSAGPLIVESSIITGNQVLTGASGVRVGDSPLIMTNTLVAANAGLGGGIHVNEGSITLTNVTVADNGLGTDSGGIGYHPFSSAHSLNIINSIIYNNGAGYAIGVEDEYSPTVQISYSNLEEGWVGSGNIDADPRFAGNGDYQLMWMSPCIDQGTRVSAPATDLDGLLRDSEPDMGAYEWPGSINFLPTILKN